MMDENALDDVPDDVIEEELLDRPIASLRDVLYTYGALYELTFGEDVDEYFAYQTPGEFADYLGKDEAVVAIDIDLVNESFEGVTVRRYTEDMVFKVAHCRNGASAGKDHSITHQGAQKASVEKIANKYVPKRLTKWPTDSTIKEFRNEQAGDDGWIIDTLAELGEDEDTIDEISEAVTEALSDDAGDATLVTVRVKTAEDGEWLWPGDVEVLQEAMKYRWAETQGRKNVNDDNLPTSRGSGAPGQVLGDDAERLVGTAETPLNFFGSKQKEKFEGFSRSDAWLSHPLSERAVARIQNATAFLDVCYATSFGARLYYLPYIQSELDADDARKLYGLLYDIVEADDGIAPISEAFSSSYYDDIVFHTLEIEYLHPGRYQVHNESTATDTDGISELAEMQGNVLDSGIFGGDGTSAFLSYTDSDSDKYEDIDDSWGSLVDEDASQLTEVMARYIVSGWYLRQTTWGPLPGVDGLVADDPRLRLQMQLVRGEAIQYSMLRDAFVNAISNAEHDDDIDGFPVYTISGQVAQLIALDATDQLDYDDSVVSDPDAGLFHTSDAQTPMDELGQILHQTDDGELTREEKLDAVIEHSPVLRESIGRRGSFLAGVLLGQLSGYQSSSYGGNLSTTVRDEFPVNRMTHRELRDAVTKALDRINVYAGKEDQSIFYGEVLERLIEMNLQEDITNWDISKDELRYWYGIGVAYGLTDSTSSASADE